VLNLSRTGTFEKIRVASHLGAEREVRIQNAALASVSAYVGEQVEGLELSRPAETAVSTAVNQIVRGNLDPEDLILSVGATVLGMEVGELIKPVFSAPIEPIRLPDSEELTEQSLPEQHSWTSPRLVDTQLTV
jgi:hypothetical protein